MNTSTMTNDFCQKMQQNADNVCKKCYAESLERCYKALEKKLLTNSIIYEQELEEIDIPVFKDELIVRIHSYGELRNILHLENLLKIVTHKRNKHVTFALWTKRKAIVKKVFESRKVPSNLVLNYSVSRIDPIVKNSNPPKPFDRSFLVFKDNPKNVKINCGSKDCLSCMMCYKKTGNKIIKEQIK